MTAVSHGYPMAEHFISPIAVHPPDSPGAPRIVVAALPWVGSTVAAASAIDGMPRSPVWREQ